MDINAGTSQVLNGDATEDRLQVEFPSKQVQSDPTNPIMRTLKQTIVSQLLHQERVKPVESDNCLRTLDATIVVPPGRPFVVTVER